MSRFSVFHPETNGVVDITWRKRPNPDGITAYLVWAGEDPIGEVWLLERPQPKWTAISYAPPDKLRGLRSVMGFATRWDATEYILNVGYRAPRE